MDQIVVIALLGEALCELLPLLKGLLARELSRHAACCEGQHDPGRQRQHDAVDQHFVEEV